MSLKPGNLLGMARLNFRVKCNNQLRGFRSREALSAFTKADIFYGMRLFFMNYTWLNGRRYYFGNIRSLRAYLNESYFYPEVASLPLFWGIL